MTLLIIARQAERPAAAICPPAPDQTASLTLDMAVAMLARR